MRKIAGGILVLAVMIVVQANAQHVERLMDLSGEWRIEAGDNMRWADPAFDDAGWDKIQVPGYWEDQVLPGYDGYAWYRRHFRAPGKIDGRFLLLRVGEIDDVDEVYVNGRFVGFTGILPPAFATAYNTQREYQIPAWLLHQGEDNVISVRVYDDGLGGGIWRGDVGLYMVPDPPCPDFSLDGLWKFRTGDSARWSDPAWDDSRWENVYVPAYWETQGHKGYDGIGWYRLHFQAPSNLVKGRLIMLLGQIDDIDESYLNGQKIGHTGTFSVGDGGGKYVRGDEYAQLRAYSLPSGLVKDGENVLAVRVLDTHWQGGIYRGPVGLI